MMKSIRRKPHKPLSTLVLLAIFMLGGCKKEEDQLWVWCNNCSLDQIVGNYEGKATYYDYVNDSTYTVEKEKDAWALLSEDNGLLEVNTGIVNLFSIRVTGSYNNQYYIEIPGPMRQFSAVIWRKGDALKIKGVAKKLRSVGGTTEADELIDFELFKKD